MKKGQRQQAPDSSFSRLSTSFLPAGQRFDFWRSLHNFIDLDVCDKDKRQDFTADLLLHLAQDGSTFGCTSSDDLITRFAHSSDEYVLFSRCLTGSAKITTDHDATRIVTPASGLMVVDGTRAMTVRTEGYSHVYLTVPKARLSAGFADRPDLLQDGFCELAAGGLATMLTSHLMMLARQGEQLDRASTAIAIEAAVGLATGTLAQAHVDRDLPPDEHHDKAFYTAACRYIQLHIGARDLTAEKIAGALGCSRAHLYRVFAQHEQGIGDAIRLGRFEQALALLGAPAAMPIEEIATTCGFASPSAFTRWFRNQAGLTPTVFREKTRQG